MRNRLQDYAGPYYEPRWSDLSNEELDDHVLVRREKWRDVRAVWFMWGFIAAGVFATLVSVIRG